MKRWGHNVTAILPERLLHGYVDVLVSPSKRKAIEHALGRDRDMRETVETWRSQNANLRLLALLEELPPMSLEMQGTVYRLEGRLRRRSSLEFLRVAAVVTLLIVGAAGTAILAQSQLTETGVLAGLADDAAQAHRVFSRQLTWGQAEPVVEQPEQVPAQVPATAQATLEANAPETAEPATSPRGDTQTNIQPEVPEVTVVLPDSARDI